MAESGSNLAGYKRRRSIHSHWSSRHLTNCGPRDRVYCAESAELFPAILVKDPDAKRPHSKQAGHGQDRWGGSNGHAAEPHDGHCAAREHSFISSGTERPRDGWPTFGRWCRGRQFRAARFRTERRSGPD
jgi:hypothetical protein